MNLNFSVDTRWLFMDGTWYLISSPLGCGPAVLDSKTLRSYGAKPSNISDVSVQTGVGNAEKEKFHIRKYIYSKINTSSVKQGKKIRE